MASIFIQPFSGTRISLGALTEVLHRNSGHAFSLTENVENLHEMLGLTQLPPVTVSGAGAVNCSSSRLVSVMEDLYEGLPLVAVEDGQVTTIQGSNFCHGGRLLNIVWLNIVFTIYKAQVYSGELQISPFPPALLI